MASCCCLRNSLVTNERDLGTWWLPAPSQTKQWLPIPILSRNDTVKAPWGYERREGDDVHYHPIPDQLELLEEAKKHLKKYSYKNVAAWLSKRSGRSISADGLRKRIGSEQTSRSRLARLRRSIERLEAKIRAAQAWEAKIFERYKDAESPVNYLVPEQGHSEHVRED